MNLKMKSVVFSFFSFFFLTLIGQSQNIECKYELKQIGKDKHQYKVSNFDSIAIERLSFLDWLNSDKNKLDGEIIVLDEIGNKRISATFISGAKVGIQYYWYKSGELESEMNWETDQTYNSKTYYKSGKIKSTAVNGHRNDAIYTNFYENGNLKTLYDYSDHIEKSWYENGQIKSDRSFKEKIYTEWYSNGIIKLKGPLNLTGWSRIGKWSYYDINGKLTKELFYEENNVKLFSDESGWINEKTY